MFHHDIGIRIHHVSLSHIASAMSSGLQHHSHMCTSTWCPGLTPFPCFSGRLRDSVSTHPLTVRMAFSPPTKAPRRSGCRMAAPLSNQLLGVR